MSVRLSCPSCNTAFALDAVPADRRATCPRCGDVFPLRGELVESEDRGQRREDRGQRPEDRAATKHGWSRRAPLVAVTLGLFGVGVVLAFYFIRGPKPKVEPSADPGPRERILPPHRLTGLGYLPAECNVVFAVQPGPLLDYAAQTKQEPREFLTRAGVPVLVFTALDQVGLPLTQIDHIAGGIYLGSEGEELRVAIALVLSQPLADEDAFLKKLKAKPVPGKKDRYTVEVGKLPLSLAIARVSPTVWVFGLNDKDFEAVEKGGYPLDGTQFRSPGADGLRKMLGLVSNDAAVWGVAYDDRDWAQKPLVKLAAQSPEAKKWLPAVGGGRGGLFGFTFGGPPRIELFIRSADAATGERVNAYLQARAAEIESATGGGFELEAGFNAPFDPALLQRLLADAAK